MMSKSEMLSPLDAAEYLGSHPRTLAYWRAQRRGPAYVKVGRVVRYRLADLEKFVEANTVTPAAA